MLAAAGGELRDSLDYPLTQRPGGVGLPLHGGIKPFRFQFDVVDVPGLGDAVGERQNAVAGFQPDLARGVLEAIEDAEGRAGSLVADRLSNQVARGMVVEQRRADGAGVDESCGMVQRGRGWQRPGSRTGRPPYRIDSSRS